MLWICSSARTGKQRKLISFRARKKLEGMSSRLARMTLKIDKPRFQEIWILQYLPSFVNLVEQDYRVHSSTFIYFCPWEWQMSSRFHKQRIFVFAVVFFFFSRNFNLKNVSQCISCFNTSRYAMGETQSNRNFEFVVFWTVLILLSMGWKTGSSLPDTSQRDIINERRRSRHEDFFRFPDAQLRRKRRNALTMCMMEDIMQTENFQSLLNIYTVPSRRNSRTGS